MLTANLPSSTTITGSVILLCWLAISPQYLSAQQTVPRSEILAAGRATMPSKTANESLYDQTLDITLFGTSSQDFLHPLFDPYDNQAADDFVVPSPGWRIDRVTAAGFYISGAGPADSFNVTFYRDLDGFPGNEVCDYSSLPFSNPADTDMFSIDLPNECLLSPGHYWLSIQSSMSFQLGGQWLWFEVATQTQSTFTWRNPADGFGSGCTSWTHRIESANCPAMAPDLAYQLEGSENGVPVIVNHIPDQTLTLVLDATFTRDLEASPRIFLDPDGDELSYIASSSDNNVASVLIAGSVLTVTAQGPGLAIITVEADDGVGGTASLQFNVTVNPAADLAINKDESVDPVIAGDQLTYFLTLTNRGPSAAANAVVTDSLPAGVFFVSNTEPAGWSCAVPEMGEAGLVTCSTAALDVETATIEIVVETDPTLPAGSILSNSAIISSDTTEANAGDEEATETTTVLSPADVYATKVVRGGFYEGGRVVYEVLLRNSSSNAQSDNPGPEFTDTLPIQLRVVGATADLGVVSVDQETNTVIWNGSIVGSGGEILIVIESFVNQGTAGKTISNQGIVLFDSDGDGTNEATRPTDDPEAPGEEDPTEFNVLTPIEIPTLSGSALVILVLSLLATALSFLRRQR